MIRLALAAALFSSTAYAETKELEADPSQNLAFCGSQVATLAWFYQGLVSEGSPELQPELDALLNMQSIFIGQVEQGGDKTIELFKKMTKVSVTNLAEKMNDPQLQGAAALSDVNTNVRGCVEIYFEKTEDGDAEGAADSEEN